MIDPQFSSNTVWDGPDIPCLGICNGQTISKIIYTIANKVCDILSPLDLSTITLDCALEIFNKQPILNRTIQNIFQLLIDNECGLKTLIDNLQLQVDGITTDNFIIDLKCLKTTNSFGSSISLNRDETMQLFVNEICSLKTNQSYLDGRLTSIQNQFDAIDFNPTITEPSISTCIFPTSLPTSQQVIKTSADYCNYKTLVGQSIDIATARSKVPANLNLKYGSEAGWIVVPANFMQEYNNLNIIVGKLIDDISTIKNNCCQFDCDSIKIGFGIEETDHGIVLVFTSLYGNKIPTGFVDNGSKLTISQESPTNTQIAYIPIQNDYTSSEIVLNGFTEGKVLTFILESNLKNIDDNTMCEKIITKSFTHTSGCCVYTNATGSDVTITYETPINSISA